MLAVLCYEILAGVCLISDGHAKVLNALTELQEILGERTRFQRIVDDIYRKYRSDRETERVRIAAMSLINALLSSGPAEHSLEFRMHLRIELLMLGLHNVLKQLRNSSSTALNNHLDLFEMSRQEDEQHFARNDFDPSPPTDTDNPVDIVEVLMRRLNTSIAMPHFISILQRFLLVPSDDKHVYLWRLFDIVLQQLILQAKIDPYPDVRDPVIKVDMNEALSKLHTQHEYDNLEKMYSELEEELRQERLNVIDLQSRLADCDGRSTYSRRDTQLIYKFIYNPCKCTNNLNFLPFIKLMSLADKCFRSSADSTDSALPSDPSQSPSPSSLVPPMCPPLAPPPPPPLSSLKLGLHSTRLGIEAIADIDANKKNIPKSVLQLKTLNWIPIPKPQTFGTIWESIDEENIYSQARCIDLDDFTQNFVLAKASAEETEQISETLRRKYRAETLLSIIEPRRAQNCTIMLSKLRMSNKQIKRAILSMDQYSELPRDMIEQILKFMPSKEEKSKLHAIVDKYKTASVLAVADRFLYEISNVSRYEQRLRCLHIISTYHERADDVSKTIETVKNASIAVMRSERLRQLLRLILALGNFLNRGKRNGNAYGFTLGSLRVLTDVRNSQRHDRNLLHYIVKHMESKQPEVLRLKRDLEIVYQAAKHNRKELEKEFCSLRKSITIVMEELQVNQTIDSSNTWENECSAGVNSFIPVLKKFLEDTKNDFAQIEKQYDEMNTKFRICVRLFAEEPKLTSFDDFFGVFSKFITALTECRQQLWEERENLERIRKQTLTRSILTSKCMFFVNFQIALKIFNFTARRRDNRSRDFDQLVTALQSGEIFSEELSRLRTSFRACKEPSK
ncbi:unnamed protein product [Thelazia callipaeda]|uniref:FH2 domain-containing protein n=1 Tax=Thelazia callipaeda TaxID=103827 RepID=A0A0N5CLL6_THECL|nr:unnamed protein product [Thelazia callipaeda]